MICSGKRSKGKFRTVILPVMTSGICFCKIRARQMQLAILKIHQPLQLCKLADLPMQSEPYLLLLLLQLNRIVRITICIQIINHSNIIKEIHMFSFYMEANTSLFQKCTLHRRNMEFQCLPFALFQILLFALIDLSAAKFLYIQAHL